MSFCWDETFGRYSPLRPKCFPRFWYVCKTDDFRGLGLLLFYRGNSTNPPGTFCSGTCSVAWVRLKFQAANSQQISTETPFVWNLKPKTRKGKNNPHLETSQALQQPLPSSLGALDVAYELPLILAKLPNELKQKHLMQMLHHMAVDILIVVQAVAALL